MRAGQFRVPDRRRGPRAHGISKPPSPSTISEASKQPRRRHHVLLVIAVALLAIGGVGAGILLLGNENLTGAILGTAREGKSRAELQAELDQEVQDNMMTVSVLPSPRLSSTGMLEVGFENDADNKFAQRFTLTQDGSEIYRSDAIEPGQRIDEARVKDAKCGAATVRVQAVDPDTGADHGSPTAIEVNVVDANDASTSPATGQETEVIS